MLSPNKDYIQNKNNIEIIIKELFEKEGFYPWNDSTFSNYFGNIYEYITKDKNTFLSNSFPPSVPRKESTNVDPAGRCFRRANNNRNFITWMLENQQGKLVEWINEKDQTFYLIDYNGIFETYSTQTRSTRATTWGDFQVKLRDLQRRRHLKRMYNYPQAYHCYRLLPQQTTIKKREKGKQVIEGSI